MKLLVFGSLNIDFVYRVEHIVKEGETTSVKSLQRFLGGKGFNQAIAIARSGVPVSFAGCIGQDGTDLAKTLNSANVDTSLVKTVSDKTGQAIIQVDDNGQNSILIFKGANALVTTDYIDTVLKNFDNGDFIIIQNEISNLLYLIKSAKEKGLNIILNPSPFDDTIKQIDLSDLYCLILNEVEATQFFDTDTPTDFLDKVKKEYPNLKVMLTLGKKGCEYHYKDYIEEFGIFDVKVVDTTAAGDTFTGYFVSGIYNNNPIPDILRKASAASSIAVSKKGASSSIPTFVEVEEFLKSQN